MEGKHKAAQWRLSAAALIVVALLVAPSAASARKKATIKISDAPTVTEGATTARFKVSLSRAVGHAVGFDFTSYDGSAEAPIDYDPADSSAVIAKGKRKTFVAVDVNDDVYPEPTEAFGVAISNVHGAKLSAHRNASAFIKDNDPRESEPNDTIATANTVTETSETGAHFALNDVDTYRLLAPESGSFIFRTQPYGDFSCPPGAGQIDSKLTIFASNGTTQLGQNDDIAVGTNLCSQVSLNLTSGQTYFAQVTDGASGGGSIFDYTLEVLGPP